jgi:hypothetical protein
LEWQLVSEYAAHEVSQITEQPVGEERECKALYRLSASIFDNLRKLSPQPEKDGR